MPTEKKGVPVLVLNFAPRLTCTPDPTDPSSDLLLDFWKEIVVPSSILAKLLDPGGSLKIISGTSGDTVTNTVPSGSIAPTTIPSVFTSCVFEIFIDVLSARMYAMVIPFANPTSFEGFGLLALKVYKYCVTPPCVANFIRRSPASAKLLLILKLPSL